jgi:outer membrane receptor for ferrienterochelin and colicins
MRSLFLLVSLVCVNGFLSAQTEIDTLNSARELNTVVVTGQYVPTDARNSVNLVRTIDTKTIKARAANNLEELLATDPNIRISQDGVFGSAARMNGISGENLKILIDGVPVMGRLNGGIDLGQVNLQAVKQVEIIDGAQSLMYGNNAAAGVINLITQRSQAKPFEASVQTQLESNGFTTHQARLGVQKGKWNVQINATDLTFLPTTDSIRTILWNPKDQQAARASVRYRASDAFDIRLSGSMLAEEVDNLGEIRRPQFRPYAYDDIYRTQRGDLNLHMEGWLKNRTYYWQFTSGVNDFTRIRDSYRLDIETDTVAVLSRDTSASTGYLNRFTFATDYKNPKWNLLFGLENFIETAEGARFLDTTRSRPGFVSNSDLGIFGSVKFKPFTQLTLQAGARYTVNQIYGTVLTPSFWAAWLPNASTSVRFTYANGFRAPGMKELYFDFADVNHNIHGNTDLGPENAQNFRVDIKQQMVNKSRFGLALGVNGFYNQVKDRISLIEVNPLEYTYLNIANYRNMGYGATLSGTAFGVARFSTGVVHTAVYNELHEKTNDPKDELNWSLDWVNDLTIPLFDEKLSVNVWHKRTGKTFYISSEDFVLRQGTAPEWSLLNASLTTQFWKQRIRISGGVKNILDKQTLPSQISDGIHSPVAASTPIHWGRTLFVTASVSF